MRRLIVPFAAVGLLVSGAAYAAQSPHHPAVAAAGSTSPVQQASAARGGAHFQPAIEGGAESRRPARQTVAAAAPASSRLRLAEISASGELARHGSLAALAT
jgi:hypothetical protein